MDEVIVKGTKYISSKRASKQSGYAKDYIGQLVRMGKVKAIKVGRSWFVEERAFIPKLGERSEATNTENAYSRSAPRSLAASILPPVSIAAVKFPSTWSEIRYTPEEMPLLPPLSDNRDIVDLKDENTAAVTIRKRERAPVLHFTELSSSIDGIRVQIRPVEQNVDQPHTIAGQTLTQPAQSLSGYLLRMAVAAILVSMIAFLVPIFG